MMNRLGPPVSGGILSRLGPKVGPNVGPKVNGAPGGETPKANLPGNKNVAAAPKANKAGQVFFNNVRVLFREGKVFSANGVLLSSGGAVKFQNGRLEYVGGTKGQAAGKKESVLNRLAEPVKPAVAAPAKIVATPAKTPAAAPAKASVKAPARTPISFSDAETKVEAPPKPAPAKTPVKKPIRAPITAPTPEAAVKKAVPAKSPVSVPKKTPISAPTPEAKKVVPPTVLAKKGQLKGGVVSRLGPAISNGVQGATVNNKRKPAVETHPAKKVKEEVPEEVIPEMKEVPQIKDIVVKNILNVSPNMHSIDLVCVVPGEDNAIIKLQKAPFGSDVKELQEYLKGSSQKVLWKSRNMANVSLSATETFDNLSTVNAELTYPATESQITDLKQCTPPRILRETPEFYIDRVMPYVRKWLPANKPHAWKWVDDILSGKVDKDRVVGSHKPEAVPENGYTLVKDIKWAHDGIEDMHILGIIHRKDIFCLRDLSAEHVPLLKGLYLGGTSMIRSKYGVQVEDQVVFLLYYPSTYHLHVHYTSWGKYEELGRLGEAHLLVDVISNLEDIDPNYYRKVTLNVVVNKSYEFLYNSQEGTVAPLPGMERTKATVVEAVDPPITESRPVQPVFRDPSDPFYLLQAALLNILGRFQEVLHGNLGFLRLPIRELMKHILNQPRELMDRIAVPLKELMHHLENRPLDHLPQLEGVLAELLQYFQKHPLEKGLDPGQNQN